MSIAPGPLSLHALSRFQAQVQEHLPSPIVSLISSIVQFPVYDECKTTIDGDRFPTQVYRKLKTIKDLGLGDYKVGGSTALKFASADQTWENSDVDIMVHTKMKPHQYATALGLTTLTKSWIKGVDPMNVEGEEKFHQSIYTVLTFTHDGFDKKIQLVFFDQLNNLSFINFLDKVLDYPGHVLYEVDFDKDDKMTYNFFLPIRMWEKILQKRIPRELHCVNDQKRIQKYIRRGFAFV